MKLKFRNQLTARQLRDKEVTEISKDLQGAKSLILFASTFVKHQDFEALRRKLKLVNAKLKFIKNTLFKVAATKLKLPAELTDVKILFESTAIIYVNSDDFIAPIKIFKEAFGKNETVKVKIALLDHELYPSGKVLEFAGIPTKEELYSKLVGSTKSPIYRFYYSLSGMLRKLVVGLDAIAHKV